MFVIQQVKRQPVFDISTTFQTNNIPFVFWDRATMSTYDMYACFKPKILIVMEEFGRLHFDELFQAKEKYCDGKEHKIAILNMDFKGDEAFGFRWGPCINNIMYPNSETKTWKNNVNVSLIMDDGLEHTHHSFAIELAEHAKNYPVSFRIYSSFVKHYSNVGDISPVFWQSVLKYSDVVLDPRNEIGQNTSIYGNTFIVPEGINSAMDRCMEIIEGRKSATKEEKIITSTHQTKQLLIESGLEF